MNISSVVVALTSEDILNMIKENLNIEYLSIDKIEINNFIKIEGTYKKILKIPFYAKIGFGNIQENKLSVKIFSIKVLKLGIIKPIKSIALDKALKKFKDYGVNTDKDNIFINLNEVTKLIPNFYLNLKNINLEENIVKVEIEDIKYDKRKPKVDLNKEKEEVIPLEDSYTEVRVGIINNTPDKYRKIIEYSMVVPDIVSLLWRIFKDKRVSITTKGKAAAVLAYLAMPFDILPDFIPFIGKIDDVVIAFYGLNSLINEVPEEIIKENWQGDKDIIVLVKEVVKYISQTVGIQNVKLIVDSVSGIINNSLKRENKSNSGKYVKKSKNNKKV
ncbi:YkvA family protein [Clostridium tetani]|uniref:YkvA family protein n=1 Tax=Clostridium tetani TaxID=1513 RepID=UPI0005135992|nr:YkvA family protein [Clostridium tetani]KGI42046.1 hypothetical protein KY55_11300 [Clostridium tetani]RXI75004.1 DUF1232 domain-containing protein [Clostridium tetani]BDR74704.1 hypothetical protein K154306013_03640 [Clostridium tetani]BDR85750.1 hypothetical protein N071400001_03580 [Clostridium tetani]